MKVAFHTLGCKVNQYETEAMGKLFESAGWEISSEIESADVVVVNTCTVTSLSSQKSRQIIRRSGRLNENAILIVVGCYAQNEPEEVAKIEGVDIVIGTKDRVKIVEFAQNALKNRGEKILKVGATDDISDFEELPHSPHRTRAFLKIEDGCNNFCSYCIIPYVRGRVRSRSPESIRRECEELKNAGYKEIVLTGIHIGAYGRDFKDGTTLADAVKIVLDTANPARLRLGSVESAEMTEELINLIKTDPRICNHVHLPLQSGSDEILKAMRRPYTTKIFAELVNRLAEEIPEISIGTDLIVGFPGETEELFDETRKFLETLPLSKIHVFPYSLREGTSAAKMKNQIDAKTKKRRTAQILEIAENKTKNFAAQFVNRTVEIIPETNTDGIFDGLTKNYIRVFAPVSGEIQAGEFAKVKISGQVKDGLTGNFV